MAWSDIPTCKESGVDTEYQMLRGIFMSPERQARAVAFYVDLFKKVMATDDWKSFMEQGAFNQTFMTGDQFKTWVANADKLHHDLMKEAGFLAAGSEFCRPGPLVGPGSFASLNGPKTKDSRRLCIKKATKAPTTAGLCCPTAPLERGCPSCCWWSARS